ncbi:hypothetical protein HFO38_15730 [Rhizobium leguminosarum]|uniref:hypothetical protein n=1 Tax=Rhizobium leguminosarum TaxID=384 RepID=UPI001C97054B|nr:hypothetical protein [Rhizobium leguminosarum]MBY5704155.1 hypothetical protein [Rhizobium leguminosarum]
MPHHGTGPYLSKRKARRDANGNITHKAVWIIRDGEKSRSTRCSIKDFGEAKRSLEQYRANLYAEKEITAGLNENEVLIADLIRYYLECNAEWLAGMSPAKRREAIKQFARLKGSGVQRRSIRSTRSTQRNIKKAARPTPLGQNS